MDIERPPEFQPIPESLDKKLGCHGLETEVTIELRGKIIEFLEYHRLTILQELETSNFSIMVGGSLQAGTADQYSDIDLTIILDKGDTGAIWTKGGISETNEGIRGIFLFRQNALRQQTQRDVDINLISLEDILTELNNLDSLEEEELIMFIGDIVRIFSPQLYQAVNIDEFRKLIITKLTSIFGGEEIWDQKIVPQLRAVLIEREGDEKGEDWPEREERDSTESQKKNDLTKRIVDKLKDVQIPNFQEMRVLYGV